MKLLRADLRSRDASLELLAIRNLETSRRWTNDPDNVIEADTHISYVAGRLGDDPTTDRTVVYFVVGDDDVVAGYQRFDVDKVDAATWYVSTAFGPSAQGKGYGTRSMAEGIAMLAQDLVRVGRPIDRVLAWIHPDNVPSIKMCERSGFVRTARSASDKAGRAMDLYERLLARG